MDVLEHFSDSTLAEISSSGNFADIENSRPEIIRRAISCVQNACGSRLPGGLRSVWPMHAKWGELDLGLGPVVEWFGPESME